LGVDFHGWMYGEKRIYSEHVLRAMGVDTSEVEWVLAKIRAMDIGDWQQPWLSLVEEARAVLNEVSRK